MYIQEFIIKYCQDLLQDNSKISALLDSDYDLEYDYTVQDIDGTPIKVICVDNLDIPVNDILLMEKETFLAHYQSQNAERAYDNYLKSISFLQGEEALSKLRLRMQEASASLEKECEMVKTWSDLNS